MTVVNVHLRYSTQLVIAASKYYRKSVSKAIAVPGLLLFAKERRRKLMRRRGRSPTQYRKTTDGIIDGVNDDNGDASLSPCEPMDEDEQRELVQRLRTEAAKQSKFFQQLFGFGIGGFATILSLLFPMLCPDECHNEQSCWVHSVYSSLVHIYTVYPFIPTSKLTSSATSASARRTFRSRWKDVCGMMLHIIPFVLWCTGLAFNHDIDHFHLGLIIGNLVTYLGSWLVYWDMQSTNNALQELDDAQYRHKSL
jgi:hypothetical protein